MFTYCNNNPINFQDAMGTMMVPTWAEGGAPVGFSVPDTTSQGGYSGSSGGQFIQDIKAFFANTDEQVVLKSKFIAFYNGTLVVRHSIPFLTSWASHGVILLNNDIRDYSSVYQKQTLMHEYGHILQEQEMGTFMYNLTVFLPSVVGNVMYRIEPNQPIGYYDLPWEYDADIRGNVNREHSWGAGIMADYYFTFWGK